MNLLYFVCTRFNSLLPLSGFRAIGKEIKFINTLTYELDKVFNKTFTKLTEQISTDFYCFALSLGRIKF